MAGEPTDPAFPSEGVPRPSDVMTTGPARSRAQAWFGDSGVIGRVLTRWGFPLFVLAILIIGRDVLLPFVFAGLIAYILAPVVRRISERANGRPRMPRGLAIIICYIAFLAAVTGFMFLLVPRLSREIARLGNEASYKRINEEWTPQVAHWLEERFPSLRGVKRTHTAEEQPAVADVPVPPGTAFTMTPLPDGRFAVQLVASGVDVVPRPNGGFHVQANEVPPEPLSLEDRLRTFVDKAVVGLQDKLNELVRLGQSLVTGLIRGIFGFFITLMIAAFILIDMEKVHVFLRSLFPANVREDYDVIVAGMDRGLSGVIRGQLLICVINSVLTYIGLLVFGVKYSLILAVVAGLMSLIPIFGAILSSVPIVLVALVSGDAGVDIFHGIAMLLWIVGIHFIEANLLNPKIIGTAAKIHPVLVIFALVFGEYAYGLVGALLAVPVLSAIQVIFLYFYNSRDLGAVGSPLAATGRDSRHGRSAGG